MTSEKKQELINVVTDMLPDPIIIIGYLEHQIDLISKLIVDFADSGLTLSPEATDRLNELKKLLEYSSINFENLDNPIESYKLPKAKELKSETRSVQGKYLKAKIREGTFK